MGVVKRLESAIIKDLRFWFWNKMYRLNFPCSSIIKTSKYPGNYSTNDTRTLKDGWKRVDWPETS